MWHIAVLSSLMLWVEHHKAWDVMPLEIWDIRSQKRGRDFSLTEIQGKKNEELLN